MKVVEFINKYKESKVQNTKMVPDAVEQFLKKTLEVKEYVSFEEKKAMCESVLEASCTKNGSFIEMDSVSRYLLFTIAILSKYTNLEFGKDEDLDPIDEYDLICKNGLLNELFATMSGEYASCNNILNMMMGDIEANNNNLVAVFNQATQKILSIVDELGDTLKNKVEALNLDLSQIDIDKYKGLIDMFTQK